MTPFTIVFYTDYTKKNLDPATTMTVKFDLALPALPDMSSAPPQQPRMSNYLIDFLLIHYDEMFGREITVSGDVLYKQEFQDFLGWVYEFKRIVLQIRDPSNSERLANEPEQLGSTNKVYGCTHAHQYTADDVDDLKLFIGNGKIDPKKYYTEYELLMVGFDASYFDSCYEQGMHNLIVDVLVKTEESWQKYLTVKRSPKPRPISDVFNKFSTEFDQVMAETNEAITSGDYNVRYTIIQEKIKDTVNYLDILVSITNTETNVIEHTAKLDGFYKKLSFGPTDVDQGLEVPTDTIDLVNSNELDDKTTKSLGRYEKMASSQTIADAYNIAAVIARTTNVGAYINSLRAVLNRTKGIENPSAQLNKLIDTKIYIDAHGKKKQNI